MVKYHINDEGNPGLCFAKKKKCPYGGPEDHYSSRGKAREAFEGLMRDNAPLSFSEKIASFKRFRQLGRRQGWDISPSGEVILVAESYPNTFDYLHGILAKGGLRGDAFAVADQLKSEYARGRDRGEFEPPSFAPDDLSRDAYLSMVAPATAAAVLATEEYLESQSWTTRDDPAHVETNYRVFSELLALDMNLRGNSEKALERLIESGWQLTKEDDPDLLAQALTRGQRAARVYGDRLAKERKMFKEQVNG